MSKVRHGSLAVALSSTLCDVLPYAFLSSPLSLPPRRRKRKEINFYFFPSFLAFVGLSQNFNFNLLCAANSRAKAEKKRQPTRGSNNNCQVINVKCQTDALSRALFLPLCACVCTTVCVSVFGFARFCFCPSLYLIYYLGVCIK